MPILTHTILDTDGNKIILETDVIPGKNLSYIAGNKVQILTIHRARFIGVIGADWTESVEQHPVKEGTNDEHVAMLSKEGDSETEVCTVEERAFLDALYKDFKEYCEESEEYSQDESAMDFLMYGQALDISRTHLIPILRDLKL